MVMNIGDASRHSGLPAKTIRYYEEIGLVMPARHDNGYRAYAEADTHKLSFLRRARGLGFSIEDCRSLLSLYENKARASADVKALALTRISEVDRKIAELEKLRAALHHLSEACLGDSMPECPILNDLSGPSMHPQTTNLPSDAVRAVSALPSAL
jgi:Cu(I)-responsive transcriptional regulator